jgi:hypothetical protein
MVTIICSYCQYVGQGEDYNDKIKDVISHEEVCSEWENDCDVGVIVSDIKRKIKDKLGLNE